MMVYKLSKDPRYKYADYSENTDWHSITCPINPGHQRAGTRIGNMSIELPDEGRRDFYWTFLSELIITDFLAELLQQEKLTGFKLKPVQVSNIQPKQKLWEFIPTGKGGLSFNYQVVYECKHCGLKYYRDHDQTNEENLKPLKRVLVDESKWDGSDIFTVDGLYRYILMTEKVKNLIMKNKLKGGMIALSNDLDSYVYPI